jgi:LPXTG-site transpeptidase (sortase) family protein
MGIIGKMLQTRFNKYQVLAGLAAVVGIGLVIFGARNLYFEYQLLNSPFDQVDSYQEAVEVSKAKGELEDVQEKQEKKQSVEFLPAYVTADEKSLLIPEILEGSRVQKSLIQKEQILDLDPSPVTIKPVLSPERLVIERIDLEAGISAVAPREVEFQNEVYLQWTAPRSSDLGWHNSSSKLGSPGNTVINGHSSGWGESFRYLEELENGDLIFAYSGEYRYTYTVANVMILKERWESIEVRMENARWINPSQDERLTLISCWPYNSNTHRLVIVAKPVAVEKVTGELVQDLEEGDSGVQ